MLLAANGVAVIFEAKVLSDISTHVTFDLARNQLARNIDVMLDANPTLAAGSCRLTKTRTAPCSTSTYPTATAPNWPEPPDDWAGRAGKTATP